MPRVRHKGTGKIINFPEGTPPEEMARAMASLDGPAQPPKAPFVPGVREAASGTMSAAPKLERWNLPDTMRTFASSGMFGLGESAPAAIDAALFPHPGKTFGESFREGKNYNDQQTAEAERGTPVPSAVKLAGALASPVGAALSPSRAIPAFEKLPMAAQALLGGAEATGVSGALNAANNMDKPVEAAKEGAGSWWNALGAVSPLIEPAIRSVRTSLPQAMRKLSGREAWFSLDPTEQMAKVAREKFGSAEKAGNFIRDAELPNGQKVLQAGDKASDILTRMQQLGETAGADVGNIAHLASSAGAKPPMADLQNGISKVFTDEFGTPAKMEMWGPEAKEVHDKIQSIYNNFASKPQTTLKDWEQLKSEIQSYARDTAAKYGRSEAAIQTNPVLRSLNRISGVIKEADETGIGRTLGNDAARDFSTAKREYGGAETLEPMAQTAADREWATRPTSSDNFTGALASIAGGAAAGAQYGHGVAGGAAGAVGGVLLKKSLAALQDAHATKAAALRGGASALSQIPEGIEQFAGRPEHQDAFIQFMRDNLPLPPRPPPPPNGAAQ